MNDLPKKLITTTQLANLYNVSHRTIEGWRRRGVGPTPLYLPGNSLVRYDEEEALAFLAQYRKKPIRQVEA